MTGTTLFPPVNISAAKIAASDAANYVSTVAERPVARPATGVFTTSKNTMQVLQQLEVQCGRLPRQRPTVLLESFVEASHVVQVSAYIRQDMGRWAGQPISVNRSEPSAASESNVQ